MKIISTADLHAHNWSAMATFRKGISSRLTDLLGVLDQIIETAKTEKADCVVIIGDVFHERGRISVPVFNAVYAKLKELAICVEKLIIVAGNHDHADKDGEVSSIDTFREFAIVIDKPKTFRLSKAVSASFLPFRETYTAEDLAEMTTFTGFNLMFAHTGIIGAAGDNGFEFTNGYRPEDLGMTAYERVFVGHYHAAQRLKGYPNIRYVGSPLQHSFADEGIKKSFTLLDTDDNTIKVIATKAPVFKTLEINSQEDLCQIDSIDQKWTFLKLVVTDPKVSVSDYLKSIDFKGRVTVEVIKTKRRKKRLGIDIQSTPEAMMTAYVSSLAPEGMDKKRLLEVGLELASSIV